MCRHRASTGTAPNLHIEFSAVLQPETGKPAALVSAFISRIEVRILGAVVDFRPAEIRQKESGIMPHDEPFVKTQGSRNVVNVVGKQIPLLIPGHSLFHRGFDIYQSAFRIPHAAVCVVAGVSEKILGAACLQDLVNRQLSQE